MAVASNAAAATDAARNGQTGYADGDTTSSGWAEDAGRAAAATEHPPECTSGLTEDLEIAEFATAATAGSQHPEIQPSAYGSFYKAKNGQVRG